MTLIRLGTMQQWTRGAVLSATVLALAACAEVDDTTGSRLAQVPPGSPMPTATPAGDITIVGQEVGHAILDLPDVANATVPPLVQFTGVTSIIASPTPIDTEPYTDLLRDRLLLITRLKLRFIEHTLPPLVVASKKGKKKPSVSQPASTSNPDYQILAELRGRYDADLYKIQVEFVNVQSGAILYNGLFSIRKEAPSDQPSASQQAIDPTGDVVAPPAPPVAQPVDQQQPAAADPYHQANPPAGVQ